MDGNIVIATDANFATEVIQQTTPVLVMFWAEWSGACQMIMDSVEQVAAEHAGRLIVAKHNIDQNPQTPPSYHVNAIPTLLMFKKGAVVGTRVGPLSKGQLVEFVTPLL